MKSRSYKVAPGETIKTVLSKEMSLKEDDVLGILPVSQVVSMEVGEGIIVGFKGKESAFSVILTREIANDLIEAISRALPN